MSASSSEVLDIKNFLKTQHVIVSSEWVEACATFVKQEHAGPQLTAQNLRNYVFEQWLAADLEEIEVPVLPSDLASVQKTTLNGCFALQVNGIRDISRPAYSQLKQLEGNRNANEEFSATPRAAVPDWEAKPTRMLMLRITDGCSCIQAMEFKPITFLSPNLPPGLKVLIQGPIECRFGILLLTSEKIRILGGEVESKLSTYSREAVLREVLQLPANDDINQEENDENVLDNYQSSSHMESISTRSNLPPSSAYPTSQNNAEDSHTYSHARNGNKIRTNNITSDVARNAIQSRSTANNNQYNDVFSVNDDLDNFGSDDDDFTQSLDYQAIDELERENSQRPPEVLDVPDEPDDIWQEDEDMIQEIMAFQDNCPSFDMPAAMTSTAGSSIPKKPTYDIKTKPFTYLSIVEKDPLCNCVVTIKGFIITVLSKLECTTKNGWSLMVKVNDGTSTVDADIHDKVLERIIGVSAIDMLKMKAKSAEDIQKRKEVMQAISKCKTTLQNNNCLMDIKFTPGEKPSIVQFFPVGDKEIKQLLERVSMCVKF